MSTIQDSALVGLTTDEAARRLGEDGPNELPTAKKRNLLQQTWEVVRQPMLLLLLVAGTVNFVLAEPLDGAMLMSFVVVVIAISIYQERKTENALAALRDLSSPRALVLRDGVQVRIAGRDVVRGDYALLAEGDRVPADAVLLDSMSFSVDESALTGESVPVRKVAVEPESVSAALGRPGGDATPWVFSGTLVVKGHGLALVKETGSGTELGRIGAALREIEPERTPLQREIDRLVRALAVLGVGAAVAVVVVYGLTRGHWLARGRAASGGVPRDRRVLRAGLPHRPVRPDGQGVQGGRRQVPGRYRASAFGLGAGQGVPLVRGAPGALARMAITGG